MLKDQFYTPLLESFYKCPTNHSSIERIFLFKNITDLKILSGNTTQVFCPSLNVNFEPFSPISFFITCAIISYTLIIHTSQFNASIVHYV